MSTNYPVVSSEEDNLIFKLRNNIFEVLTDLQSFRLGQVLTVVDGCISDPEQRKAIKNLIRSEFWREEYWSKNIPNILWRFDKASKLHLINDDRKYRQLYGYPEELPLMTDEEQNEVPGPHNRTKTSLTN